MTTPGLLARADIVIRRIRPEDARELERFYADLSDESRALRFLGASRGIRGDQARVFCTTDHHHREGFVAVTRASPRIVGHVCIEPDDRGRSAEVAIAVADAWQHRGIGLRLISDAVTWARGEGIERFTATMWGGNAGIARLLDRLALPVRRRQTGGVLEVTIELGAGQATQAA